MIHENKCPFCNNSILIEETINFRQFFQCKHEKPSDCSGFFVNPYHFSSAGEQKKRYLLHTNELALCADRNGYRKYLEKFTQCVLSYAKKTGTPTLHLFDYGSGPSPALVMLLKEYNMKFFFQHDVKVKHWDPFFYPEGDFFENGADIVFCLEVIEHFENPLDGFRGLATACAQNGLIAVKTQLAPKDFNEFRKWWYKEDKTHVSFYTMKSIENCAGLVGLHVEATSEGVVFLRKI